MSENKSSNYVRFKKWLSSNESRLEPFYVQRIGHSSIDFSRAMDHLAQEIRRGDEAAVAIGFDLLVVDPIMPFGKIIKSKILNAFASKSELINARKHEILYKLYEKWMQIKPFPPREIRYLMKVLKRVGK